MTTHNKTKMIVEAGIMIGLATALSLLAIIKLPQGGSVTAGSMIPIILFSLRYGIKPGLMAGTVYGVIQYMIGSVFVHPLQVALDYIFAFGLLGMAGLFHSQYKTGNYSGALMGGFIAVGLRFVMHLISGVVFFAEYAPEGMNLWVYSGLYNGSFLGVELVVTVLILSLLVKPLSRLNNF